MELSFIQWQWESGGGFQVSEWAGQICQQHLRGCTRVVQDGVRETSGEAVWAGVQGLSEKRCGDLR